MSGIMNMFVATKTTIATAVDAFFNSVSLLLNTSSTNGAQNNTFLDSSTNNFAITRNGNTTQGTFTPFSQTGWSNYFNGSSNLATVSNPNLAFGTGDITCEFWMNTFSNSDNGLFGTTNEAAWNSNSWSFKYSASAIVLYNGNSGGDLWSISTGTLHDGAWHHVAIVRSSGTWQVFVDGVSKGTTTTQGTRSLGDNSWRFAVGSIEPSNSDLKYTGYLSNFRLNNTALYSSNFTPSTTPLTAVTGTKLLTCQSNRFLDNSSSAIALTVGSAPSVQAFSPFAPTAAYDASVVGGSGYFDGSGDYLTTPSSSSFNLSSGDWTIEGWFWLNANSGDTRLFTVVNSSTDMYGAIVRSGTIRFGQLGVGEAAFGTINLNSWNHIAFSKNSTSTITCYINGISTGTTTSYTLPNANCTVYIAASPANYALSDTNGYVSNFRIVKGTAVYTSAFTPPTAPLTAITNTSLLLSCTNAGIYDSASKNVLETIGNAQVSTTQAKWGTTAMYFDGNGDWLLIPNNQMLNLNADFTIEFWIYLNSTSSEQCIFHNHNSDNNGVFVSVNGGGAGKIRLGAGNGSSFYVLIDSSTAISASTWTYVACTRSGSTWTVYINGSSAGTATSSSNPTFSTSDLIQIGRFTSGSPNALNAYIGDLRITKYARTISASPTAAFPLQ